MIAARLTMRALLERNAAVATDTWGQPGAPDFQPVGDPLPCFVYNTDNLGSSREVADGQKIAEVEESRAMFALDADVRAADEIASVTDRKGNEIIPGRLKVMGPVQRRHTHLEANLRRIG